MTQWISVKEKLPPVNHEVFVFVNEAGYTNKGILCAAIIDYKNLWQLKVPRFIDYFYRANMHPNNLCKLDDYLKERITHWRFFTDADKPEGI